MYLEVHGRGPNPGTSGWTEGNQFTDGYINFDPFAARLVVFMILLSWNRAWWFIWDGTPTTVDNPIENLFLECEKWNDIGKLLFKIGSRIGSESFREEWALYCRSATTNFQIDSNTQKSINIEKF